MAIAIAITLSFAVTLGWSLAAGTFGPLIFFAMFGVFLLPALVLVAVGVLVIYVIEGRRIARDPAIPTRQRTAALCSPIVADVFLLLVTPSACSAGRWGRQEVVLDTLEPAFGQMMAASASGRAIPPLRHGGQPIIMSIEKGDPPRYYFQIAGLGDNSSGFVYDPTDAVLAAKGWGPNQSFTAPPQVREWFGGDILWCQRVRGHYHYCGLT